MGRSGVHSWTPLPKGLLLGPLLVVMTGSGAPGAGGRASGTESWDGKEITYALSGESDSDTNIRFSRNPGECRITMTVAGVRRTVVLRDEDVDVEGERLDVGSYGDVFLSAARDFLILKLVTTRSWSASTSREATARATSGTSTRSTGQTNASQTSGQSTDYHAFGFTRLGDMKIRVRLKGGRSVDCWITAGPNERVIRFDVDGGKKKGSIAIQPGLLSLEGDQRRVSRDARILVSATKGSLRITADGAELWSRD